DQTGAPRTDNLAFANAVVQWLRGPVDRPRTRCLFVDGGRVVTKFDEVHYVPATPPPPTIPIPDLTSPENQQRMTDAANAFIAEQEDKDVFNGVLANSEKRYTE